MPPPHTRPKAAEVIANWLRGPIVSGEMPEDTALPNENQLSEELGVSRPIIREAIRILESEGLIVVRRGVGGGARTRRPQVTAVARAAGFVLQERGAAVGDVFRCREFLEVPAIDLIAEQNKADRRTALDRLDEVLRNERADVDPTTDPIPEGQFHRVLVELAGSATLELYAAITNQIIYTHTRNFMRERGTQAQTTVINASAHAAHARLVELLRHDDIDAAKTLWREHLRSSRQVLAADRNEPVALLDRPLDPRTAMF
jgi:DNA-binding FadR family transcriptional regulator